VAQTTASRSACDVVVSLEYLGGGGALYDISGSTNQVTLNFSNEIATYRRTNSDYPVRYMLNKDLTVSLTVLYSEESDEGLYVLRTWATSDITFTESRTVRIDIPDSNTNSYRYQFDALASQFNIPASSGEAGPILVTATLESSGAYAVSRIS